MIHFPHSILPVKPVVERIDRLRLSMDDFDTLEIIGRGAFGEVKVSAVIMSGEISTYPWGVEFQGRSK